MKLNIKYFNILKIENSKKFENNIRRKHCIRGYLCESIKQRTIYSKSSLSRASTLGVLSLSTLPTNSPTPSPAL